MTLIQIVAKMEISNCKFFILLNIGILLILIPSARSGSAQSDIDDLDVVEESLNRCDMQVQDLNELLGDCTEIIITTVETTTSTTTIKSTSSTAHNRESSTDDSSTINTENTFTTSINTANTGTGSSFTTKTVDSTGSNLLPKRKNDSKHYFIQKPRLTNIQNKRDTQFIQKIQESDAKYDCTPPKNTRRRGKPDKPSQEDWGKDVNDTLTQIDNILIKIKLNPYDTTYATQLDNQTAILQSLTVYGDNHREEMEKSDINDLKQHSTSTDGTILQITSQVNQEIEDNEKQRKVTISLSTLGAVIGVCIIVTLIIVWVKRNHGSSQSDTRSSASSEMSLVKESESDRSEYVNFEERFRPPKSRQSQMQFVYPTQEPPTRENLRTNTRSSEHRY